MGPALCLFSAACFGAMAIFGKLAYAAGVSPGALLLLRFSVAAVLLGLLLALRPGLRTAPAGAERPVRTTRARLLVTALGLGALGYATQATLYFSALQRIDASLVALVLYTYPALVTVAAAALGRERLTPARSAALVVASCGTLLVLLGAGGFGFDPVGVGLAFGAAVTYTVYILVADTVVHRLSPVMLAALVMTGASGALAVRDVLTGGVDVGFGPAGWVWIACIAVVSTVLAMLAFFAGLRRTGPSTAAILSTFEPVVTTALAAVTLNELLTPVQLVGGLVVLSSVVVLQLRPQRGTAIARARRPARGVPAVGDVLAPLGLRSVLSRGQAVPDAEVGHEPVGGGAVPVPLDRRPPDHVTRAGLDDAAAAGPGEAHALRDVQGLTVGVPVPGGTCTRVGSP